MSEERDDPRDAVDALIDESARLVTSSEPPAALRARVRASIDSPPRRRPWAWQPALAGAAVVLIASIVVWQRPFTSEPVTPPSIPQRLERAPDVPPAPRLVEPPQTARNATAGQSAGGVARPPSRDAQRRTSRGPAASAQAPGVAFSGPLTPAAEPLPVIEPIVIEPVEPSAAAAIERMPAPMPVEIERLEIELLE
jgi:hypothetical protein